MQKLWHKMSFTGVRSDESFGDTKRVIVTNQISAIVSTVAFVYGFIFHILNYPLLGMLAWCVWFFVGTSVFLNYYGARTLAKYWMITFTSLAIFTYSAAVGKYSGISLLYYPALGYPLLVFDLREKRHIIFGLLINAIPWFLLEYTGFDIFPTGALTGTPVPVDAQVWLYHQLVPLSAGVMLFCITYLLRVNFLSEEKLLDNNLYIETLFKKKQSVFQAIPDTVFVLSDQGICLDYKPSRSLKAFEEIENYIGNDVRDFFEEEIADRIFSSMTESAQSGDVVYFDFEEHGSVNTNYFEARVSTLSTSESILIVRDVTKKKQNEKLLNEQNALMANAAKMTELGKLATNLSHEINNPLAIVIGYSEELLEMYEKGDLDLEQVRFIVDKIHGTSMRISRIVTGMKAVSRSATNEQPQLISIQNLIDDVVSLCAQRMKNFGIEFSVNVNVHEQEVECRPTQIVQVLLSVINNAFDAVKFLESKWIRLDVEDLGSRLQITVTDSGKGIPIEVQKKIFDPFFTTKNNESASGLGMNVSLRLMESHKGTLFYDNNSLNTKFVIELPLRQQKLVA